VYPSGPGSPPTAHLTVRCPSLPYNALTFISESSLIAAGHDCQPIVYTGSSSGWTLSHSLDDPASSGSRALTPNATGSRVVSGGSSGGPGRLNTDAFNLFRQADTRGTSAPKQPGSAQGSAGITQVGADGMLLTVHQNSITSVEAYEWSGNGDVGKITTVGKDGRLVIWNVTGKSGGLAGKMAGLSV
jgi:actin related protein 2/3 complex subunit 1A/1B